MSISQSLQPARAAVDLDSMLERHNSRFGAAENLSAVGALEAGGRFFIRIRKREGGNVSLPNLACVEALLAGLVRASVSPSSGVAGLEEVFEAPATFEAFTLGYRIGGGAEAEAAPLALAA